MNLRPDICLARLDHAQRRRRVDCNIDRQARQLRNLAVQIKRKRITARPCQLADKCLARQPVFQKKHRMAIPVTPIASRNGINLVRQRLPSKFSFTAPCARFHIAYPVNLSGHVQAISAITRLLNRARKRRQCRQRHGPVRRVDHFDRPIKNARSVQQRVNSNHNRAHRMSQRHAYAQVFIFAFCFAVNIRPMRIQILPVRVQAKRFGARELIDIYKARRGSIVSRHQMPARAVRKRHPAPVAQPLLKYSHSRAIGNGNRGFFPYDHIAKLFHASSTSVAYFRAHSLKQGWLRAHKAVRNRLHFEVK